MYIIIQEVDRAILLPFRSREPGREIEKAGRTLMDLALFIIFLIIVVCAITAWIFQQKINHFLVNNIFISVLVIFVVGFLAVLYFWNVDNPEYLRNIILLMGVVGGAYGILLASERQKNSYSMKGLAEAGNCWLMRTLSCV